jgi:hypothetical protein
MKFTAGSCPIHNHYWRIKTLYLILSIDGSTALVDLGRSFSFLIYTQIVIPIGRWISLSQGRYLHTGQHKRRINAYRHPCLSEIRTTIPVFEGVKTVHALDRTVSVFGPYLILDIFNLTFKIFVPFTGNIHVSVNRMLPVRTE